MELYNTCTRLIEKGKTAGMQKKLDIFFANDRLTEEEYTKLCAQLAAKQKVDGVMLKTVSTNRKLSKRADGLYIDPQFERNYVECNRLGIPVGVYYYTYAVSRAGADAELAMLKFALTGKTFELPVAVDVEDNKLHSLGKQALTNQVLSALGKPVLPIESAQLEQIVTTGITRYRKGYPVLIRCPDPVQTQPDRLQALQKEIYMPVADAMGLRWKSVESVIRRAAALAWKVNPERVQELAGYPLAKRPTAGAFLEMLCNALTQRL